MQARVSSALAVAILSTSAGLTVAPAAQGQVSLAPGAEERKQAAADFAEGDRAFKDGDFRHAAESYDRAYQRLPHHATLWNSARAWHHAGEMARAANLYARYLREAPSNARDRNSAQSAMSELASRLARLEIHATDVTSLTLDGQPLDGSSVFVTPGDHIIEGRTHDDQPVRQKATVSAGDVVSVALLAPNVTPPDIAPPASPPAPRAPRVHGWSPVVAYVGGAMTVALAGVTVWSGLETLQQKKSFDATPSQGGLDQGKSEETRTNVLIGVTAGVAALTALTAFALVDWHGAASRETATEPSVELGAGLGALLVRGRF